MLRAAGPRQRMKTSPELVPHMTDEEELPDLDKFCLLKQPMTKDVVPSINLG